jgi:hypothetical protein
MRAFLSIVFAAVVSLCCCALAQAQAVCVLNLDILPTFSTFNLTTRVENNTDVFLTGTTKPEQIGVQGRLYIQTNSPTCPTTFADALTVLNGAKFTLVDWTQTVNLRVWPVVVTSTVEIGTVDLRSVEWYISSEVINDLNMTNVPVGSVALQVRFYKQQHVYESPGRPCASIHAPRPSLLQLSDGNNCRMGTAIRSAGCCVLSGHFLIATIGIPRCAVMILITNCQPCRQSLLALSR